MAEKPCETCGQIAHGQTGEYPCPECGLPQVWDDPPRVIPDCETSA